MNKSEIIASVITILFVLGLVIFRLLWAGSQVAAAQGLGWLPKFPKRLQRWLFGER